MVTSLVPYNYIAHIIEKLSVLIIIDNFCKALFSGVRKLTALYNIPDMF